MTHSLIIEEVLAHPQDISWLPWAVQYFFFIGIAACAALFACYLHWRKKDAATEENRALLIAITCAITAPLALTADCTRPPASGISMPGRRPGRGCPGEHYFCRCLPAFSPYGSWRSK